jgi:hypothetical protein
MTTATLPRLLTPVPGFLHKLLRSVGIVLGGVLEAREIAVRYERLSHMSTIELARLGLTRRDISRAAVNGVAGL